MSEKLLPCPFCGGEASTMAYLGKWITGCCDCLAGTRDDYETRARAITAWNRRSPPPAVEGGWREIASRITEYLSAGGLFNPEMMDHQKVRDLLIDARDALGGKKP